MPTCPIVATPSKYREPSRSATSNAQSRLAHAGASRRICWTWSSSRHSLRNRLTADPKMILYREYRPSSGIKLAKKTSLRSLQIPSSVTRAFRFGISLRAVIRRLARSSTPHSPWGMGGSVSPSSIQNLPIQVHRNLWLARPVSLESSCSNNARVPSPSGYSVLSSPLSSRARRSLPLRRRSTPSARRRSATWRLRRGSPRA